MKPEPGAIVSDKMVITPIEAAPLPPSAPNPEAVVYPQFYFMDEAAERQFWKALMPARTR